jgi:hypothetical protein
MRHAPPLSRRFAPQKEQRAYYYLWQLYHLSQDSDTARAQLAEAKVGCGFRTGLRAQQHAEGAGGPRLHVRGQQRSALHGDSPAPRPCRRPRPQSELEAATASNANFGAELEARK